MGHRKYWTIDIQDVFDRSTGMLLSFTHTRTYEGVIPTLVIHSRDRHHCAELRFPARVHDRRTVVRSTRERVSAYDAGRQFELPFE